MTTPFLAINGVSRSFPSTTGGAPTLALQATSLNVAENDFITILGPSGCGKSSLLRIVAGLDQQTSGEVLLEGRRITGPGADRGMVFQSYTLFPWLTVRDNVCFGLNERGMARAEQLDVAQTFIHKVGLKGFENHYPKQLSGGMQQRTAIARALANGPRMLLMDEPFGALDPVIRASVQLEMKRVHQTSGKTIIMVTHDIDEALLLATKIVLLDKGRVVQVGTPFDLLARPASEQVIDFVGRSDIGIKLLALQTAQSLTRAEGAQGSVSLLASTTLREVVSFLAARHLAMVNVVDAAGMHVGVLHATDIFSNTAKCHA